MTMHLASHAYSNIRNRKLKPKYTKANLQKWASELQIENKKRKQRCEPRLSLDDYIDLVHGIVPKPERKFEAYEPKPSYVSQRSQEHKKYPSVILEGPAVCARPDTKQYTGTLVKGIGMMHKSNLIPIIDEQQARDIATMRRN